MNPITYKFIEVRQAGTMLAQGQPMYGVYNHKSGDLLAAIDWYPQWWQFVVTFNPDCVFSTDCLADVRDAISKITVAAREFLKIKAGKK